MFDPFDKINDYISEYDGDEYVTIEAGTPASEAKLDIISRKLGIELPAEYKKFLSMFGSLVIGGAEFIGVSGADYLDVVRVRDELVKWHGFPNDLIPFLNEDGDSYVCIRPDSQLVRWVPKSGTLVRLSESMGEYLLRRCDELIEEEGDCDD